MTDKPIDIQHEEEMAANAEGVSTLSQLNDIRKTQEQIVDSLKQITDFITALPKQEYEDENGVKKNGPLWELIKRAKKVGAF